MATHNTGCAHQGGNKTTLLLWDSDAIPPKGDWIVILWRSFGMNDAPEAISIPMLVEQQADELKTRYLAWIYEMGETRINGKRLVDHLELRPGFSAWWMSLLTEKCNFAKSPQIDDAIRLTVFESWAIRQSMSRVVLASANARLAKCVCSWCCNREVGFEWQRTEGESDRQPLLKRMYQYLPHPFQALIWLFHHLVQRWPLRGVGLREWCQTEGQVAFISYLFNLVPDAAKEGRFESRYWAHLPAELQQEGCKTNWLHLYVKDALLPTAEMAADAICQFNKTGEGWQAHATLDTFLGVGVVFRTLRDWFSLAVRGWRLQQAIFSPHGTALDLWPLFRDDWYSSLSGQRAMSNVLYNNLFESAMKSLPKQRVGVYLQENQSWEYALIHAWRAAGQGRLIGTPHSTVRYWDLRYFFDSRNYRRTGGNDLPLPDQVALNGLAALEVYMKGGYPEGGMVEVEALRYLHLAEVKAGKNPFLLPSTGSLRVLVLGDYLLSNTQQQMHLLEKAAQFLPADTIIIVKSHPNCPVQAADYPGLRLEVTMDSVSKLLSECNVAYTSSITSAAVDAFCAGVPVVSVLDPNTLNLSPLRGREGALFASTPEELVHALIRAASSTRSEVVQQDYFTLDHGLPRWRKLLLKAPVVSGDP